MITGRTSFWEREIEHEGCSNYLLKPFSRETRRAYWVKRLENDGKVNLASQVWRAFGDQAGKNPFFDLPNAAAMIADLVERIPETGRPQPLATPRD